MIDAEAKQPAKAAKEQQQKRTSTTHLDNRIALLLRKLYEKRSLILALIESYLLRNTGSNVALHDDSLSNEETYKSFLDILRKQQRLRLEVATSDGGFTAIMLKRMRDKYQMWNERKLNRLLSLLNDLYRQIQTLIADIGEFEPWNKDMLVLTAVTGNNTTQVNVNLMSDIYSEILRLV